MAGHLKRPIFKVEIECTTGLLQQSTELLKMTAILAISLRELRFLVHQHFEVSVHRLKFLNGRKFRSKSDVDFYYINLTRVFAQNLLGSL